MKSFNTQAAQGDVLVTRITALPRDAKQLGKSGEFHIVGHSETGHHHAVPTTAARLYTSDTPLVLFLVVTQPTALYHQREWDQHEELELLEGMYEIRNQREHAPEGWRKVQD